MPSRSHVNEPSSIWLPHTMSVPDVHLDTMITVFFGQIPVSVELTLVVRAALAATCTSPVLARAENDRLLAISAAVYRSKCLLHFFQPLANIANIRDAV